MGIFSTIYNMAPSKPTLAVWLTCTERSTATSDPLAAGKQVKFGLW